MELWMQGNLIWCGCGPETLLCLRWVGWDVWEGGEGRDLNIQKKERQKERL